MSLLVLALAVLVGSGLVALCPGANRRLGLWVAALGVVAAAVLGGIPAVRVLAGGGELVLRQPWLTATAEFLPKIELSLKLDALAAWFLIPILGLSALAAVYGVSYMAASAGRKAVGASAFFFNVLVASMVLVVLASNAVVFLIVWEVMAVASFLLVTFEHERAEVREAGWVYLVATHLGTVFLLVLFLLEARATQSMDFATWTEFGGWQTMAKGKLFVLALIGFGTKAGFMPIHVWLPEAHPAAPSHVSALMSGVMIKTGIYGLLRTFTFLGEPADWWGWVLVGIGLSSGILGVLFAAVQNDLKRLLAYSSVENIGIVALGLGLGLIGVSKNLPTLAVLGMAGALLHVVNHACFKGLLFLAAGSVLHGAGTRVMDQLGGLLKRMPWTGALFLVGAAAICGLPPLNGFISELLIFLAAFAGALAVNTSAAVAGLAVMAGLALIGGLAVAAFTKAFGITFLGEPRTEPAAHAHEAPFGMRLAMGLLAAGCVAIASLAPALIAAASPVVAQLTSLPIETVRVSLGDANRVVRPVVVVGLALVGFIAAVALYRHLLLARRRVSATGTWDCGYARPTARMQYTASSFAQPIASLFKPILGVRQTVRAPDGLFPTDASYASQTPDLCHANLYQRAFAKLNWGLAKLRWLQQGQVQVYVLYVALTLLVLLIWRLG